MTRAIQVHGALGISDQMPLVPMLVRGLAMGLVDGPTEVHKINVARQLLKSYEASDSEWPAEFLDNRIANAAAKYGDRATHESMLVPTEEVAL